MQFNERAGRGTSLGLMVGGRDSSGNDVSNELTGMFIESIAHTRLAYPSIGLCVTDDTPPELLARSARILAAGASHPALFNDEVIVRGLRRYGLPRDEACEYIHSSCVEITPVASSGVWVASPYHNLVQYLLDIIGVPQSGEGRTPAYGSFDELVGAYRMRLGEAVRIGAIAENAKQAERSHAEGEDIIAACFTNDCLERGLSLDKGGARYNWIMPSFVGLANLADSLLAIRQLVFEERSLTLAEFSEALRNDFREREYLRLQIMNRVPHYGNDDDAADAMVAAIAGWLAEETSRYTTFRGGRFIPSLFCWVMHERLGKETPASPDGRRAGEALGDGSGPAQGREMKGPTASILSSTKWDHEPFIGGIAVNMKFGKRNFSGESLEKMIGVIRTFFARGGFELQVNVVDRDTLLAARAHPERYKDLVVRIGGYSDYFTSLPTAMQEEILQRTEHAL
jgi:formate C-acetyltransferase